MFNVGGGELLVILLIALIVLGPNRLPDAARQVGKVMGDLRKLSTGFQNEMRSALDDVDDPTRSAARRNVLAKETPAAGVPTAVTEAVQSVSKAAPAAPAPSRGEVSAPAKKTPAKKTPAKKTPAKKTPAKKTPAKKTDVSDDARRRTTS
jgi:sec-independent protein translocase protein TatB